ncbi:MAG: NnrS family protein [Pseudomonadota bacterium]|nr:NnrS family protein [Pseudomonadota bacterium]
MTTPTLLASPFRLFFLLAGLYGAILVPLWLGILLGGWPAPALDPLRWHVHEMLFGLVGAAIAGFLLTAMANWTGTRALDGWGLLVLALAWLLGRLGPWLPGGHPLQVAFLDLLFWLGLALYVARVIIASGNRRNGVMVGVMALLFGVNLLIQLDFIGILPGVARLGEALAIDLVVLLMVVVAGRITPAFTANWLERQGGQRAWVRQSPRLDGLAIVATALMIPVDAWGGDPRIAALVALLAAVLNTLRLTRWAGWRCLGEPLLWILHLGYGWIVAALVLKGLAPWLPGVSPLLWLHAAGVGAMGTLILGVMTRVALGHTGRPLVLPRGAVLIYGLISLAALARLLAALGWAGYRGPLVLSGLAFSAAFALFLVLYWRILASPRVDGRPG